MSLTPKQWENFLKKAQRSMMNRKNNAQKKKAQNNTRREISKLKALINASKRRGY